MLVTLALLVICASIAVFFSQEFTRTYKKIMKIKGAALLLPLVLASMIVYNFIYVLLSVLIYVKDILQKLITWTSILCPCNQWAAPLATILVISVLSVLPVYVLNYLSRKKTYQPYKYPYLTSLFIWIVLVMLVLWGN